MLASQLPHAAAALVMVLSSVVSDTRPGGHVADARRRIKCRRLACMGVEGKDGKVLEDHIIKIDVTPGCGLLSSSGIARYTRPAAFGRVM
jgi:hypothetical protein